VSYTYSADGTLATKTDANGNTETYTYDAYQRLTAIPDRQQTFVCDVTAPGWVPLFQVDCPCPLLVHVHAGAWSYVPVSY
jgi:YD repeat-containing protein